MILYHRLRRLVCFVILGEDLRAATRICALVFTTPLTLIWIETERNRLLLIIL